MKMRREKKEPQGSGWTFGRQAGAKAVTVGLIGAILCGPLALAVAWNANRPIAQAATNAGEPGLTADQQSAGAYAVGYVAAWLSATRKNPGDLGSYVDLSSINEISEVPWEYRDLALVSVQPVDHDAVSVVVSGNVRELATSDGGETTADAWPRRYFQTTIRLVDGATRAIGLPAPIAAPAQADTANLIYTSALTTAAPAGEATMAFLGAYLAGSGDVTRYTSPNSEIQAIAPAPYVTVDAVDLRADGETTDSAPDGAELHVLATVKLASLSDQRLTSSYALTMTARAGRWEVTAIDPAPHQTADQTEPTTKPTPTASPKGK